MMQLQELRAAIIATADDVWHRLPDGPLFRADEAGNSHPRRAVLTTDVDVALEWGLRADDEEDADVDHYDWAEIARFQNPAVAEIWVDVFYRGELVDRAVLLDVDGQRAFLPPPVRIHGVWATRVWARALARLTTDLSGRWGSHDKWDGYLHRLNADHSTY